MNRGVEEPFEETLQTTSRRLFMQASDFPTTTLPDRCPVACLISQRQSSESPARDDVIRLTSWGLARRTGLRASPQSIATQVDRAELSRREGMPITGNLAA